MNHIAMTLGNILSLMGAADLGWRVHWWGRYRRNLQKANSEDRP